MWSPKSRRPARRQLHWSESGTQAEPGHGSTLCGWADSPSCFNYLRRHLFADQFVEVADFLTGGLETLADNPGQANQDSAGQGWLAFDQLQQVGTEQPDQFCLFRGACGGAAWCRCGEGCLAKEITGAEECELIVGALLVFGKDTDAAAADHVHAGAGVAFLEDKL